ncbi:hypothetical protein [Pseudonocardia sp.]|jgi:hypothetical protein|uniref:hypothetical protein n=1 Tax=Pseudonocardia sp. TaxID=60912 RepID=UPI0031FC84DE
MTTGARRGEICALRWNDVSLDAGVVIFKGAPSSRLDATLVKFSSAYDLYIGTHLLSSEPVSGVHILSLPNSPGGPYRNFFPSSNR